MALVETRVGDFRWEYFAILQATNYGNNIKSIRRIYEKHVFAIFRGFSRSENMDHMEYIDTNPIKPHLLQCRYGLIDSKSLLLPDNGNGGSMEYFLPKR